MVRPIESSKLKFLICYASQKGTAQSIAEDLVEQCENQKLYNSHISCISDIKKIEKLKEYSCVIFVGSTTGDGDPPETARKFMRELKESITKTPISWLHYTVLGLGDTNYTNFCNFGKTLDQTLHTGKAHRFYNCGWADDGTGLEIVVEPWIEDLFPALKNFLDSPEAREKSFTETKPKTVEMSREVEDVCNLIPDVKKQKLNYTIFAFTHRRRIKKLGSSYPFIASDITSCYISSFRRLTTADAVKQALEISLKSAEKEKFFYEPGDSFGIIVKNKEEEVDLLLNLLSLNKNADLHLKLKVDQNTSKKSALVPKYIPSDCTLRYLFTYCLDIRTIPKKPFLRALVEHTSNEQEKRRLMELVSKEGSDDYNKIVRLQGLTFIDLLLLFPSCIPPVSLLVEHLSRLLPRYYSVTSSPLKSPDAISFVFNVIEIPKGDSVMFKREGVCTGWLNSLVMSKGTETDDLHVELGKMSLDSSNHNHEILIYFRSNQNFRLPQEINTPIIMIGPGTGVAPFIGFITHRKIQIQCSEESSSPLMVLFFGCRHKDRDFLYRHELMAFTESGSLSKMFVSFSRDENQSEGEPKYVQDNLILQGEEVIELIDKKNASVYVCGDAKNMSKNVLDTLINLLKKHLSLSDVDARRYIAQMQLKNRYLQDVWA
ncbi:Methionine synthase reductase [Armadillidium vulgare]|nr:Methionine synthase reductase [Armadillidium vulgare]